MKVEEEQKNRWTRVHAEYMLATILAAAWRIPSSALCRDLVSGRYTEALANMLGQVQYPYTEAMDPPLADLAGEFSDAEVAKRELEAEYIRLFVAAEHVECPPYESVWRDLTDDRALGQMFGAATDAVVEEYRRNGLQPDVTYHDAPDHIAVELEFVAYLCQIAGQALQAGDADACAEAHERCVEFVRNHPSKWVTPFADAVVSNTDRRFYSSIANITRAVLDRMAMQDR